MCHFLYFFYSLSSVFAFPMRLEICFFFIVGERLLVVGLCVIQRIFAHDKFARTLLVEIHERNVRPTTEKHISKRK